MQFLEKTQCLQHNYQCLALLLYLYTWILISTLFSFPLICFPLLYGDALRCALIIPMFGIDIFMVLARHSTAKSGEQRDIS